MPEFSPTPEQQRILDHRPGEHARVLAGPGTGKSATLVALVNELLGGTEPLRIKLLTFTRAATAELAKKVSEHPATAAEQPSTVHSFAISVLLQNPGAGDFPHPLRIADEWELDNLVRPTLAQRAGVTQQRLRLLLNELAANWDSLQPEEHPDISQAERTRFLGAWNEHREVYGYVLLGELPYQLLQTLQQHADVEGLEFDLLIVDEYQDLNACDLALLKEVGDLGCSVIGAGDDDQSIYSFRKAAPQGIRNFLQDYPGARDYPLSVTQRCGRNVIEWACHVIEGDPDRPTSRPRLTPNVGSPAGEVALLSFVSERQEASGIADIVQGLIQQDGVPPSEVLILLRGDHRNMFSQPIKTELEARQIACADPNAIKQLLAETPNRLLIARAHLVAQRQDSLAWATLLHLTPRIGPQFVDRDLRESTECSDSVRRGAAPSPWRRIPRLPN